MDLDIEIVAATAVPATDIVSVAEQKRHLRIAPTNTSQDTEIQEQIEDAVDMLDGPNGTLNRAVRRATYVRYMPRFPSSGIIRLPYPPVARVLEVSIDDGYSPQSVIQSTSYTVRTFAGATVAEIEAKSGYWPATPQNPRAVRVVYEAGYEEGEYPPQLKRLVKLLAAHWFENKEATVNEARQMMVNRKIEFGVGHLYGTLLVPHGYDWD